MNSNYYILTNLIGCVNTPDEAYRVLHYEIEHRQHIYRNAVAGEKISQSKALVLDAGLNNTVKDSAEHLRLLGEQEQFFNDLQRSAQAQARARVELDFLVDVLRRLDPHRKYASLPLLEAFEACQAEEWALELVKRAKVFMLTAGTIPHDHFSAMMQHPWFEDFIAPQLPTIGELSRGGLLLGHIATTRPVFMEMLVGSYPELSRTAEMPALPTYSSERKLLNSATAS